jgi:hypothetical protein
VELLIADYVNELAQRRRSLSDSRDQHDMGNVNDDAGDGTLGEVHLASAMVICFVA